jgi:hypothetical protein
MHGMLDDLNLPQPRQVMTLRCSGAISEHVRPFIVGWGMQHSWPSEFT